MGYGYGSFGEFSDCFEKYLYVILLYLAEVISCYYGFDKFQYGFCFHYQAVRLYYYRLYHKWKYFGSLVWCLTYICLCVPRGILLNFVAGKFSCNRYIRGGGVQAF